MYLDDQLMEIVLETNDGLANGVNTRKRAEHERSNFLLGTSIALGIVTYGFRGIILGPLTAIFARTVYRNWGPVIGSTLKRSEVYRFGMSPQTPLGSGTLQQRSPLADVPSSRSNEKQVSFSQRVSEQQDIAATHSDGESSGSSAGKSFDLGDSFSTDLRKLASQPTPPPSPKMNPSVDKDSQPVETTKRVERDVKNFPRDRNGDLGQEAISVKGDAKVTNNKKNKKTKK
jgi:hypothetical protein